MNIHGDSAASEYIVSKAILDQNPAGEISQYVRTSGPSCKSKWFTPSVRTLGWDCHPDDIIEILQGTETSEFENGEWIRDFSGEPYRVLKAIPITVRSLEIGQEVEAAFVEGNIAWVGPSRVEAINGLKAEILNTLEDFEANRNRLGPEPTRQLAVLRTFLERIAQQC